MLQGTGATGLSNYLKNTLIPSVTNIRSTNIFDHEITDLAGFPAATITMQELLGRVIDNNRNEVTYRFIIRVFIDRGKANFGSSKAESVLRSTIDTLVTKIHADPTLNGNCINSKPFDIKFGYVDRENQNIRVGELTLDCYDANTWR